MGGRHLRPFLSVYGHITIDQIMSVDEFPGTNVSVDITSKDTHIGGTGTNIAVMASSLGVPTALCGFVGNDFPESFSEFIRSKGVIMDEFVKQDEYGTAQAMIINDGKKEQRVFFYQGPQGSASSLNNVLKKNASSSRYIHFSTGDPKYYIEIMNAIRNDKKKISFDPAQEIHRMWNKDSFRNALELSDILFCNKYEAASALKYMSANSLSEIDAKMIVCTKGIEGSELYKNGKVVKIPTVPAVRTSDATGAGDAYRAGFYAGMYNKYSTTDSLIIGAAAASFIVEETGALSNIPTLDMVMERADRYLGTL
ncbi:MAG: carbohydrate kinase family protein [Methanomassiliicoccaceae archaeon]|nr:carbohydrate kinase family protein [Methanomassiliicoccaceae archaeon]